MDRSVRFGFNLKTEGRFFCLVSMNDRANNRAGRIVRPALFIRNASHRGTYLWI